MTGFGGASVLEIVDHHHGDTYRAVYTVKFAEVVYVLHAFQKKAITGCGNLEGMTGESKDQGNKN